MSLRNTRNCRCEIHNNTSGVAFWVFYPVSRSFFTLTTMPPKHRAIRRPKRKFSGNQFTKPSKENAKRTKEAKEEAHGSNTLGQHTKKSVSSEKLLLKSDAMESKPSKVEFWVLSCKSQTCIPKIKWRFFARKMPSWKNPKSEWSCKWNGVGAHSQGSFRGSWLAGIWLVWCHKPLQYWSKGCSTASKSTQNFPRKIHWRGV